MAAPFIRTKAVIMCHYPRARISPPPHYLEVFSSFKQYLGIYSEQKPQNKTTQVRTYPLQSQLYPVQSLGGRMDLSGWV